MNWKDWFKTRREIDLELLVEVQQKQIDALQKPKNPSGQYIVCQVPQATDMRTYHEKLAALDSDPFYLFYLTQLRRSIVEGFEGSVGEKPEFYRGQLALLGLIIYDARKAKNLLGEAETDEV
jgi:hypothetical protein